ncbi:MAG: type II toxin-antitoxin system RelE/ParE family toxin [Bauldia sp.]|nr:type II toxin-antitoxin system RelE/ParE family toxin [Bauldia sp.]
MSGWVVETLDARVDREIEELPVGLRAALARIAELVEELGLERLREPYVKHIDGPIWEMRPKAREGIARAFYVTRVGRRIIILRVFVKKTEATPRRELDLARQRLRELEEGRRP